MATNDQGVTPDYDPEDETNPDETSGRTNDRDREPSPPPKTRPAAKPASGASSASAPSPTPAPAKPRRVDVDELPDDPVALKEHLRRERERNAQLGRENAERRHREQEHEREQERLRRDSLSESDRLKHDAAAASRRAEDEERRRLAAEEKFSQSQIDIAVERQARDAGFLYPDLVPRLIDRHRIEVEEETGEILGVKDAVAKLAKEKPDLLNARRGGGTPPRDNDYRRNGAPPRPGGDDRPRTALEELAARGGYSM